MQTVHLFFILRFPFHTESLLRQWIQFTDRGDQWQPSRWSSICSRHFLPNDFRDHVSRKCLKRFAVPSITIKSIECSSISLSRSNNEVDDDFSQTICRLCARTFIGTTSRTRHLEDPLVAASLYKCCPTIPFHLDEALPQKICSDCSTQLNRFAIFVDRIVSVQADLLQKFGLGEPLGQEMAEGSIVQSLEDEPTNSYTKAYVNLAPRMIKIKQEPFINVKQEIVESARSNIARHGIDFVPESDAFCEFCDAYFTNNIELKNHILKYHSNDGEGEPFTNNCEIMEIITLGNAFINLAEEENGGDRHEDMQHSSDMIPLEQVLKVEHLNEYEQREQREQTRQMAFVLNEHCYSRFPISTVPEQLALELPSNELQYDNSEIQSISTCVEPMQNYQKHNAESEQSIVYQCTDCSLQFTDQNLLDEHIVTHKPNDLPVEIESTNSRHRLHSVRNIRCNKRFASNRSMASSRLRMRCRQRSKRAFICTLCRHVFAKMARLLIHQQKCIKLNGKKALQERVRYMECKKINGRFACSLCDRTYTRRSNFVSILQTFL